MRLIFDGIQPERCPDCGSAAIHRSRRRGWTESLLYNVLFIGPYRCNECYERHFRFRSAKEMPDASTQRPGQPA